MSTIHKYLQTDIALSASDGIYPLTDTNHSISVLDLDIDRGITSITDLTSYLAKVYPNLQYLRIDQNYCCCCTPDYHRIDGNFVTLYKNLHLIGLRIRDSQSDTNCSLFAEPGKGDIKHGGFIDYVEDCWQPPRDKYYYCNSLPSDFDADGFFDTYYNPN